MEIIFILIGIFTLVCTYFKPDFYWESRKAKRTRALLGDTITSIIYYIIGVSVCVFGILVMLNIININ